MKIRFLGGVFAAIVLLLPYSAWAQHGRSSRGRGHSGGGVATRAAIVVAPVAPRPFFGRPYYAFQPRARVGLGLSIGYPVVYPRFYVYPGAYASPYPYYSYASPMMVNPYYAYAPPLPMYSTVIPTYSTPIPVYGRSVPPPAAVGGVGFQISPADAAVFVDGVYVGTASEFSSSAPPLSLPAGRHHFELRAQGYQTMAFDVDVIAGQVVPYEGTLQR